MQFSFSPADLTALFAPVEVEGTTAETITGIASLATAREGDLSFLGNAKYRSAVATTRASAVLVPRDFPDAPATGRVFFRVENPSLALARLCRTLEVRLWPRPGAGVHPSAVVDPGAEIGEDAVVGPLCVIEAGARIGPRVWLEAGAFVGRGASLGADCRLFPGARVLAGCTLGARVVLHAGVVIGSDGFGYELTSGVHAKVPQVGDVVVGDDVEIGANTTIDRARFSSTVIGEGTKIDNLVQVGHNVVIGRHCILCAHAGIAGTTTLGDYVVMGGQSGIGGHLEIGSRVMIAGGAGVVNDLEPGSKVRGTPAFPLMLQNRIAALSKRLPELFRRVDALEAALHLGPEGAGGGE